MSPSESDELVVGDSEGFDSLDCEILIIDGPGDTTVRPARLVLLQAALAERERLRMLGFNPDGTRIEPPQPNQPN